MSQQKKLEGFDFIRSFAILIVFLGHILGRQCPNDTFTLITRILSPGLTMSLLGFISGYLLSSKYKLSYGSRYYIKRFTRIYLTLFVCLSFIYNITSLFRRRCCESTQYLTLYGSKRIF